jgi:Tfp pilus assembly ATPase PilU
MSKLTDTEPFSEPDEEQIEKTGLHATARLDQWLQTLLEQNGSDLLLIPGAPPSIRFEGEVRGLDEQPLRGLEIEAAVLPALTPHALQLYR